MAAGGGGGAIRRSGLICLPAMSKAGGGELLGVAADLNELSFERADLLVEQVVHLVDEADDGIGDHGGVDVGASARVRDPPDWMRDATACV